MNTVTEIDPVIRNCIKLLHSPQSDSKLKLRTALDEILKQKYGPNKVLSNIFGRKFLNEENSPPPPPPSAIPGPSTLLGGGGGTRTTKREKSNDSSSSSSGRTTSSPIPMITTSTQDITSKTLSSSGNNDGASSSGGISLPINLTDIKMEEEEEEEENLTKDFGDLACVVCGAMVVTAGNRLIECTECHSLYHQECHKPGISDTDANEQEFSWCCSNCKSKLAFGGSAIAGGSGSSGTSSGSTIISSGTSGGNKTLIPSGSSIEMIPLSSTTSKSTHSHSSSSSSSSSSTSSHYSSKHGNEHSSSRSRSKSSSKHDGSSHVGSSRGILEPSTSSSSSTTSASLTGGGGGSSTSSKNNGNKMSLSGNSSSGGNATTAPITPNINIVSADKRIENMKKKSVKHQESKRKK